LNIAADLERFRAKWNPVRVKKNASKQESGVDQRFHEMLKDTCSRPVAFGMDFGNYKLPSHCDNDLDYCSWLPAVAVTTVWGR
jgi:hypothetical protein